MAARRRSPASTSRTTSRIERRLRAAVRPRTAAPAERERRRRRACSADGRSRASTSGAAAARSRRRSRAISANTGVGGQRPDRVGSGELDDPTVEVWFDKTAFAAAGAVHLRRIPAAASCARTATRRSTSRCSSNSDRNAAPAVPRGGFQPDQHAELQRAKYRDRHCRRRTRHEHLEHSAPDAVRLEVRILNKILWILTHDQDPCAFPTPQPLRSP